MIIKNIGTRTFCRGVDDDENGYVNGTRIHIHTHNTHTHIHTYTHTHTGGLLNSRFDDSFTG